MSVSDILVPNNLTIYSSQLALPSDGAESPIYYYEEYTFVTGITGAFAVTTFNVKVVKINELVTITLPELVGSAVSTNNLHTTTALPVRFWPPGEPVTPIYAEISASPTFVRLNVGNNGVITIKKTIDITGNFNSGDGIKIPRSSMTYTSENI